MRISCCFTLALIMLALIVGATPVRAGSRKEPGVSDLYTCASLAVVAPDERALLNMVEAHLRAEGLGAILPGERCMVKAAATGYSIWLGKNVDADDPDNDPGKWAALTGSARRPESPGEHNHLIRAEVLRWLSINGDAQKFVDPKGIRLGAAIVEGQLDLSYANVLTALTLNDSALGPVKLRYAVTRTIDLDASIVQFIDATSARINGDVLVKRGFVSAGLLDFTAAQVHGTFDASHASLLKAPESLVMPMAHVDVSVNLNWSQVTGLIRLNRSTIDNGLQFLLTSFAQNVPVDKKSGMPQKNGLEAEYALVRGIFIWKPKPLGPSTILNLTGSRVDTLWDDQAGWPRPGNLMIGGFEFSGFGTDSPSKAKSREQWLGLQPEGWVTEDLTAPGLAPELSRTAAELANTLERIGLADDAATIRVDETRRELDSVRPRIGWMRYWIDRLWGAVSGFGFRPLRALWGILIFVGLGWMLFFIGFHANVMTPTDRDAHTAFIGKNPDLPRRATPLHYPLFNSLVYSLETFFPLVDLFQAKSWFPNPLAEPRWLSRPLRIYLWIHIIFGWILTTTLVAGVTGLIHK